MTEWFNELSPEQQSLYVFNHPKTKFNPSGIPSISIKEEDFEKILSTTALAREAFKSIDLYKDKILSFGKSKLESYAKDIKVSIKDGTTHRVAGVILNKIGLLTIGAAAFSIIGPSAIIFVPYLLDSKNTLAKIEGSTPAKIVMGFMEGVFQGIREGLEDVDRLKKAIIDGKDAPPQIFIGKKPETSSVGNLSNPSDVVKAFTRLNLSLDLMRSQSEIINKTRLIARAINLQTEVASIARKANMLFANNPAIDIDKAKSKIDIINTNLKACLEVITTPEQDLIDSNLVEYSYISHIQEETPQCFSFIKKATISKLKDSAYYVAIESASDKEVVASISDIKNQLPYMFRVYEVNEFKTKIRKILCK